MAKNIYYEPSRSLREFRLLPRETTPLKTIENISLKTPLVYDAKSNSHNHLNIPIVAAAMQSVSGSKMGIELSKLGGLAFIYCSQPIDSQASMVKTIKNHKAGFVEPKTITPDLSIKEAFELSQKNDFSTFPVTDNNKVLIGLITKNDYDVSKHANLKVTDRMIKREQLIVGKNITDLKEANALLMETHQSVLPIVDNQEKLLYLVFRKDIQNHLHHPFELVDKRKRLLAGAAINTHDYKERVAELIKSEVDVLLIDSSDGHSFFQKETLKWIKENYPDIPVIGGNIITSEGFKFLVESGAGAVKVGMGGGSICITQEQKGTGRGLATAIIKVNESRNQFFKETGKYIPIIADGGIVDARDCIIALALGADYVMMGRYFARMDESPTEKVIINNKVMKSYWGEGSARARGWSEARYHQGKFVEGVEGFVEYAGRLKDNLEENLIKIKSALSTCGALTIEELHNNVEVEVVSPYAIREGDVHDIYLPSKGWDISSTNWDK